MFMPDSSIRYRGGPLRGTGQVTTPSEDTVYGSSSSSRGATPLEAQHGVGLGRLTTSTRAALPVAPMSPPAMPSAPSMPAFPRRLMYRQAGLEPRRIANLPLLRDLPLTADERELLEAASVALSGAHTSRAMDPPLGSQWTDVFHSSTAAYLARPDPDGSHPGESELSLRRRSGRVVAMRVSRVGGASVQLDYPAPAPQALGPGLLAGLVETMDDPHDCLRDAATSALAWLDDNRRDKAAILLQKMGGLIDDPDIREYLQTLDSSKHDTVRIALHELRNLLIQSRSAQDIADTVAEARERLTRSDGQALSVSVDRKYATIWRKLGVSLARSGWTLREFGERPVRANRDPMLVLLCEDIESAREGSNNFSAAAVSALGALRRVFHADRFANVVALRMIDDLMSRVQRLSDHTKRHYRHRLRELESFCNLDSNAPTFEDLCSGDGDVTPDDSAIESAVERGYLAPAHAMLAMSAVRSMRKSVAARSRQSASDSALAPMTDDPFGRRRSASLEIGPPMADSSEVAETSTRHVDEAPVSAPAMAGPDSGQPPAPTTPAFLRQVTFKRMEGGTRGIVHLPPLPDLPLSADQRTMLEGARLAFGGDHTWRIVAEVGWTDVLKASSSDYVARQELAAPYLAEFEICLKRESGRVRAMQVTRRDGTSALFDYGEGPPRQIEPGLLGGLVERIDDPKQCLKSAAWKALAWMEFNERDNLGILLQEPAAWSDDPDIMAYGATVGPAALDETLVAFQALRVELVQHRSARGIAGTIEAGSPPFGSGTSRRP